MEQKDQTFEPASEVSEDLYKLIGRAIIDSLLRPVKDGGVVQRVNYKQGAGGYWQNVGDHEQTSGDYHQGYTR